MFQSGCNRLGHPASDVQRRKEQGYRAFTSGIAAVLFSEWPLCQRRWLDRLSGYSVIGVHVDLFTDEQRSFSFRASQNNGRIPAADTVPF